MKYKYSMSSKTEPKHEITRKELIKLLGESNHCLRVRPLVDGLTMSIADYKRAEQLIRNAQRSWSSGTIWSCGEYSLYLDKERTERRSRDSRYPD